VSRTTGAKLPKLPRADRLADARERFLCAEDVDTGAVRETILASWWRSRSLKVAADHIHMHYVQDPDLETTLARSARPVLDRLQDQLGGTAVSVVLTDDKGLVIDRRTDDGELERYLDGVQLAPGFSYAEEFVGTNGIGTALEGLQPTAVFGHEHYAENLDTLGCAGVPIRHPVSGQVLGLLDLTCWRRDAGPLLMTLAKATAKDIEQELTTQVGVRELSLFTEYLRACRRGQGIVLAVNNSLVMLNEHARRVLAPDDQAAMLARASEVLARRRHMTITMDLPSGAEAQLSCTPVSSEAGPAGGVIRAKLAREADSAAPQRQPLLPGVVGSGPLWQRASHQITELGRGRQWTALEGEAGVGKLALARAVHARFTPSAAWTVVDLAERAEVEDWLPVVRSALEGSGTLVLRHLDRLPQEQRHTLAGALDDVRDRGQPDAVWVVATMSDTGHHRVGVETLRHFPDSVPVPPLRHHIDDIRELAPFLLVQLGGGARLTCSSATMRLLLRTKWPGNVGQLRQVLRKVVENRRSGVIEPEHLPPECRSVGKRVLNPLESMERDEIVRSLLDAEGNKVKAARALGMSRATIYRKIRDYGIDIPGK
jgi:transcriptional regulator of acetoin/glycerol metabolism